MSEGRAALWKQMPIPGTARFLEFLEKKQITKSLVEAAMKNFSKGKIYNTYSSAWKPVQVLRSMLEYAGFEEEAKSIATRDGSSHQELIVTYKGMALMSLFTKKKRGTPPKFSRKIERTGWYVSALQISWYPTFGEDLLAVLRDMDDAKERKNQAERDEKERLYQLYKGLAGLYPEKPDCWKIASDLEKISKMKYAFADRLEKERKEAC